MNLLYQKMYWKKQVSIKNLKKEHYKVDQIIVKNSIESLIMKLSLVFNIETDLFLSIGVSFTVLHNTETSKRKHEMISVSLDVPTPF